MIGAGAVGRYLGGSLARQLVLGLAAVQAVLISLFVFDLVSREAAALSEGRTRRAEGVAEMLATSGVSWMLSEDLQGLDELTRSATAFDGLRYAMFVSPSGRVMAHSQAGVAGQYVTDATGRSLLSGRPTLRRLASNAAAVDIAAPVISNSNGRLLGWAWVSLSRSDVTAAVWAAMLKGVLYVAAATAFAALISGLLARSIARGLAELAQVSALFEAGDRKVRVTGRRIDEVGATGRGLNAMLETLAASENLLRRNREELKLAQRVAKLGFWRYRPGADAFEVSEEFYLLFGYDPAGPAPTLQSLRDATHPEDRAAIARAISDDSDQTFAFHFRFTTPDGVERTYWTERRAEMDESGRITATIGVCQDVTERETAAAQLRQAQKMEAVGQLTGGLAHDFNNLLGVIVGNLDFIEGDLDEESPVREFSQTALAAALRGSELTRQLLAFSRSQPLDPQVIDLNQLVFAMATLWKRTLGDDIEVRLHQSYDLRPTRADRSQVESALLNLAVNARDAMPSGGVLTIETGNVSLDQESLPGSPDVLSGDYSVVSVTDTGTGMRPEVLARVFEPFFTTKEIGRGSGLGLSMVYGFAQQSGGQVRIYSEVGHGTTVRLYLPSATKKDATATASIQKAVETPRSRSEMVLVVEDSEEVRRIAVRQLRDLGYRVLEAENGKAAVGALEANPEIDLLFTDVVMPGGMSGIELAEAARLRNPGLKVLYTTGFTEAAARSSGGFTGSDLLISKPYRKGDLALRLRDALEAA